MIRRGGSDRHLGTMTCTLPKGSSIGRRGIAGKARGDTISLSPFEHWMNRSKDQVTTGIKSQVKVGIEMVKEGKAKVGGDVTPQGGVRKDRREGRKTGFYCNTKVGGVIGFQEATHMKALANHG